MDSIWNDPCRFLYFAHRGTQNAAREQQRLVEFYAAMADGELEELAADARSLSDVARDTLCAELSNRSLGIALQDAPAAKEDKPPKIVTLRTYTSVQEALNGQAAAIWRDRDFRAPI